MSRVPTPIVWDCGIQVRAAEGPDPHQHRSLKDAQECIIRDVMRTGPPCVGCQCYRPRFEGDNLIYCAADQQWGDFSCFRPKGK